MASEWRQDELKVLIFKEDVGTKGLGNKGGDCFVKYPMTVSI